jgi:two-component system cell cycle sensor histidine kinase/response regulator CckA
MRAATVLVVDDEQQVRRLAEVILQAAGYQVYAAANAAEALVLAGQLKCSLNLLLTDMVMPEMDGHELILAIRNICPYMDTILMSGAFVPDDARFKNYGILPKPFTVDQLLNIVKDALNGQIT